VIGGLRCAGDVLGGSLVMAALDMLRRSEQGARPRGLPGRWQGLALSVIVRLRCAGDVLGGSLVMAALDMLRRSEQGARPRGRPGRWQGLALSVIVRLRCAGLAGDCLGWLWLLSIC